MEYVAHCILRDAPRSVNSLEKFINREKMDEDEKQKVRSFLLYFATVDEILTDFDFYIKNNYIVGKTADI